MVVASPSPAAAAATRRARVVRVCRHRAGGGNAAAESGSVGSCTVD